MIYAFPGIVDALTSLLGQTLGGSNVYDGPPAAFVKSSGLSIGATREDVSSEFTQSPVALFGGPDESITVACLAWSGGGGTVFKPHRDTVRSIMSTVGDLISGNPSLGGVCDISDITGGSWTQEQTGEGALVTCEFRIVARRF